MWNDDSANEKLSDTQTKASFTAPAQAAQKSPCRWSIVVSLSKPAHFTSAFAVGKNKREGHQLLLRI